MTLAVEDANAILVPNTCVLLTDVDIEERVNNRLVTADSLTKAFHSL